MTSYGCYARISTVCAVGAEAFRYVQGPVNASMGASGLNP